jgi:hypothetical protein
MTHVHPIDRYYMDLPRGIRSPSSLRWGLGLSESLIFDKQMHLYALGILVFGSQDLSVEKLSGGRKERRRFSRWNFKRNFPQRIIDLSKRALKPNGVISALSLYPYYYAEDDWVFPQYNFYVRLYYATSRIPVGYFKSYASDRKRTEIRLNSDDWIMISDAKKIMNGSRLWRYFIHENTE